MPNLLLTMWDTIKSSNIGILVAAGLGLFAVADENGGKLKNRIILFCDELGTMPPFDILPLTVKQRMPSPKPSAAARCSPAL